MPQHRHRDKWALAHRNTAPRHKTNWNDVDAPSIYVMELSWKKEQLCWPGFCTDIGAPRSVIELKELRDVFAAFRKRTRPLKRSSNRFRFADTTFKSISQVTLVLAAPRGYEPIPATLEVVPADTPALSGMDILDRERLTSDTAANRLTKSTKYHDQAGSPAYYDE